MVYPTAHLLARLASAAAREPDEARAALLREAVASIRHYERHAAQHTRQLAPPPAEIVAPPPAAFEATCGHCGHTTPYVMHTCPECSSRG